MARDWIEFIQSQVLPWQAGSRHPATDARRLSHDRQTGAESLLVRYPAGWADGAVQLRCDEEFLVLAGQLECDGLIYGPLAYAHLPAGHRRGSITSASGAVVLSFFSGPADAEPISGPADPARLVRHLDGFDVPYTGNFHPEFPPGAGRKMLYEDPYTGDQTWMLGTMPLRWASRQEVHPVVEEMYLISGEVHGNRGVMRPGAYFWRPAEIPHGPYGTLTGNLYLFRTKGGPLSTEYVDTETPFRWWPEYDPALPDELRSFAVETAPGPGWF